jgi:hypothetical protein
MEAAVAKSGKSHMRLRKKAQGITECSKGMAY